MIVSYNWLKEFVDFDLTAEELSHRLTMAGLEVDALELLGSEMDSVIVGRLDSVKPHPDADRLTVCQVVTGDETVPVVCGATNHKAGDLVALAQVGTRLPGDFKIKKSKIRGQVSMGMLCSKTELGLAEASEGILILPPNSPLGKPVFDVLGLKDARLEIGLTPNRPDCLSLVGVAREVAAMVNRSLALQHRVPEERGEPCSDSVSIAIEDQDLCPRYGARLIRGVTIGPSPEWMVKKLEAIGLRSINNVVDVTNLVLMELGHPLHAFDYDHMRGGRVVIKRAGEGETFTTLDGQVRVLRSEDLVICDGEGPVALAGIMGGENSEVGPGTCQVLLESAYFNPATVRRTSKRLGMHTEASHRFERGADVNMVPIALDRAAALIMEVAGGTVAQGMIDCYPQPLVERRIVLKLSRVNGVLGLNLNANEVRSLLQSIGLGVQQGEQSETVSVLIPTFRPDLEREIDLIEEVARLHGYDKIPVTMPTSQMICHRPEPAQRYARQIRNTMVGGGFSEIVNYSFIASEWDRLLLDADDQRRHTVRILNPLTEEQSVMRSSLVPSMLETVARNRAYRSTDLRLFELRPVFQPQDGELLPHESLRLCAAISGRREPLCWARAEESVDFYDLKGQLERLFAGLQLTKVSWEARHSDSFYHPGKSCTVGLASGSVGTLGEVHPQVLKNFSIDQPVFIMDLDLSAVFAEAGVGRPFQAISRFPDICRDSALLVDEEVDAGRVFSVIEEVRGATVEDFTLFDLYRGAGIPQGKKSLAIRVRYRSAEKTLTDEEISAAHERIIAALRKRVGAEIR